MNECSIAIVGATGAVGQVFLNILEERDFPLKSVRLCASERSVGKKLKLRGEEIEVELATPELLSEVDFAFIAASTAISRELAPLAAENGAIAIDDSSAFRMQGNVPLVVPEVNGDDLDYHEGIVSIPNCTTTPLVMALKPLHEQNAVRRVIAATYQSVTGTGAAAAQELRDQSGDILAGKEANAEVYPHQIAFSVLPHVEPFWDNGYTNEEMKMQNETRKIMHAPDIRVSSTCVRVPVVVSHSEAVNVEFSDVISPGEVREILAGAPGIRVVDDPGSNVYPTPIEAEGQDDVFVGRIREDIALDNGIAMWLSCDNLRKGAALNSLQIAEEILERDLLLK
ncbi:MAG: aspartate-semialdehyde dehydrogenase [Dehalococcoidia bacterium]|nr:aspartate-semialdehyde dehydrogenase [Dehalococcoidia bacterium]